MSRHRKTKVPESSRETSRRGVRIMSIFRSSVPAFDVVFGCACGAASTTSLRSKDNENTEACTPRHQNLFQKPKEAFEKPSKMMPNTSQNEPRWVPKSAPSQPQSEPKGGQKRDVMHDAAPDPPRPQNGARKEPKWSQNCKKMLLR